ncbi:cysteine synthase A [Flavobacterium sp. JP2137]|uniref:cysteine synthase A n=1 Tax=Flavobacterium sp. JP2137 TaxID=3414510 RepID=UPI003D2FEF45
MKYNNVLETIGNTPHIRLSKLFPHHEVWIKLEKTNPGGSLKDRIALGMITAAEKSGDLQPGGTIIEPTSGNTGIGLALVAALKGYRMIVVMPESMSVERQKQMKAFGADIRLTPRDLGMKGAIALASELAEELEGSWIPQQFENAANPEIHRQTTAQEILADFPEGFDYFISGVGTGGHLTGIGEVLKSRFPHIKIIAVEPSLSAVLSGGNAGAHPLQGIGAGFIPKNLHIDLLDGIEKISKEEAYRFTLKAATHEGLFVGISTGASLAAVDKIIATLPLGSKVLTINYDTGERYLSVEDLF